MDAVQRLNGSGVTHFVGDDDLNKVHPPRNGNVELRVNI